MAKNRSTPGGSPTGQKPAKGPVPTGPGDPNPSGVAQGPGWLEQRQIRVISLLLFIVAVCVYLPALHGDFIFFDDSFYVTKNVHVNTGLTWKNVAWAFLSREHSNWHPLTWLSHMLDCEIYGLAAWGHHLTSILFASANAVLVFLVFREMTGAVWRSLTMAALYGLHPLRVESVVWICERKDVLSTFFALLALWAYVKYAKGREESRLNRRYYILALLFFAAGLMSKAMLVTLPVALLLLDYWPLGRLKGTIPSRILEKVPFAVLGAIAAIIEYSAQSLGGRITNLLDLSVTDRVGNALVAFCRYFGKMLWPARLCVFYPHPGHWPGTLVGFCALVVVVICTVSFILRRQCPYLITGWLWYLITLIPVIGLVQIGGQAIADRYTYIPSLGLYIFLVWGGWELISRWHFPTGVPAAVAALLVVACTAATSCQIVYWKDGETLFRRAISVTTNNYVAHTDLGEILFLKGRYEEALTEHEEAARLKPDFGLAQYDLAYDLARLKRNGEAIVHYRKCLEIQPRDVLAQVNLGCALVENGEPDEAVACFQSVLKIQPTNANAQVSLATIYAEQGRIDEAFALFEQAYKTVPESEVVQRGLGNILLQLNRPEDALPHLRKAVSIQPDDPLAHNDLGVALFKKHQLDEAIREFQRAIYLNPADTNTRRNLDHALAVKHAATSRSAVSTNP